MHLSRIRSRFTPPWITAPIPHAQSFLAMTGLVAYGDLVTKWVAVALWSGERVHPLVGRTLSIQVVHNTLGAFSTSLGQRTWEINVAATIAAVLLAMMVCPRLARIDAAAPGGLGLIAGGGVGNLASLLGSTRGVPDFLMLGDSQGNAVVLNLADLAAYMGIACCLRVVWTLGRAALVERHDVMRA